MHKIKYNFIKNPAKGGIPDKDKITMVKIKANNGNAKQIETKSSVYFNFEKSEYFRTLKNIEKVFINNSK